MKKMDIPYYSDYISDDYRSYLLKQSSETFNIEGLKQIGQTGGLETKEALVFLCDVYQELKNELGKILSQRIKDRNFIDERTKALYQFNYENKKNIKDPNYQTVLGQRDSEDRIVIGPHSEKYMERCGDSIATLPAFLQGPHVTLFGPPDNVKMSINAMNAFHRKLKGEPEIIETLLKDSSITPKWGADDEDSKTPLRSDFVDAAVNLTACLNKTISHTDPNNGKEYNLAQEKLASPFKRFPGLALPCNFLFLNDSPIPLHLYDFVLHTFENWHNPEALVFYVPKLENEDEAKYIHKMIHTVEKKVKALHPEYILGTVRLLIVLENPRAVFRTNEIMDALFPYFAGASLGWHDYLGSTARLFKEDANYRIPVKADPNIVIKYIKGSHELLAKVVGARGGIKIGGMYGTLPVTNDLTSPSFQETLKGYIKDVITQFKRELTGFWVAHPDFVRIGIALVVAWEKYSQGEKKPLLELVTKLVNEKDKDEIISFIQGDDIEGLNTTDPLYARALIAADIVESDFMANNDPREIRYNVFQTLQYLADWLRGNGCVALPADIDGIPVRVMDDLATCERSRWEVWHELYHERFELEDFLKIAFEEMNFIRRDLSNSKKIVQVKWNKETDKWYPIAFQIMLKLMTDRNPVEFASELLIPFTTPSIRNDSDPLAKIKEIDAEKYQLTNYIEKFTYYFERCGEISFAKKLALSPTLNLQDAKTIILKFTKDQIVSAASFHGDIGHSKKVLDPIATKEQSLVNEDDLKTNSELIQLGTKYIEKFGFKFLVSAQGKTGTEMLSMLKERINNTQEQELESARSALFEITEKRLATTNDLKLEIENLKKKFNINSASFSLQKNFGHKQTINLNCSNTTYFQYASLSKTIASAFSIEFFKLHDIDLETEVETVLERIKSKVKINSTFKEKLKIKHLMSHNALNMHYVFGMPLSEKMPTLEDILIRPGDFGYEQLTVINSPGNIFQYSGGGFLLLQYLVEKLGNDSIENLTRDFTHKIGMKNFQFSPESKVNINYADGFKDDGSKITGSRLMFPSFAAGASGTPESLLIFLEYLTKAKKVSYSNLIISKETATRMLFGEDLGSRDFMGCDMGVGVFTIEAGDNTFALHQGANDGFRSIFLYCVAGPDQGTGMVGMVSGDNQGMLFLAEATQIILEKLGPTGIDFNKFEKNFEFSTIPQEKIVNLGYKELLFKAFKPTLPEKILNKGPLDPLAKYNLVTSAKILKVSNQKFARAQNLLSSHLPIFEPKLFGKQGKVMDSWETERHNFRGGDYLEIQLKKPSDINYLSLSTKYHLGNQVKFIRVLAVATNGDETELLRKIQLQGHAFLNYSLQSTVRAQKIRIEVEPDGGLTRLGLYKDIPDHLKSEFVSLLDIKSYDEKIPTTSKPLQLIYNINEQEALQNLQSVAKGKVFNAASAFYGAKVEFASDEHYAPATQVISPYIPLSMFDGFESARSHRLDHFEKIEIRLAALIEIHDIQCDFTYFVNNNPHQIAFDIYVDGKWSKLTEKIAVKAFKGDLFCYQLKQAKRAQKIRVLVYPDGGINRIKVNGKLVR